MKLSRKLILSAVCSMAIFANAQELQLNDGWNLLGATQDINASTITCANTVWKFDSQSKNWSLYKKDSTDQNNHGFPKITTINQGEGYWVYAQCPSTGPVSGKLVDPYIQGATLCQDTNSNNTCDTNEPTSTVTTANGDFTFNDTLTPGKNIIIETQGMHDGVPFDLDIKAVVASDGSVDVVSPLTTFESRGLSATQIAQVLNKAATDQGITGFTLDANKVLSDPLANSLMEKTVGQITDEDLVTIQAALASYGILKIMEGSTSLSSLSSTELYTSGITNGGELNEIAKATVKAITDSLTRDLLTYIETAISQGRTALASGLSASYSVPNAQDVANSALPEASVSIIVKVATKIINDLAKVGYETCNETAGNDATKVTAALQAVGTRAATVLTQEKIIELGTKIYAFENKEKVETALSGPLSVAVDAIKNADANLKAGLEASNTTTTFVFDTLGNVVEHSN